MKVSVMMVTYNQSKFIEQAIESVLMQQVDFEYEIIIGEDYSTDNTRDIVIDYQNRYPTKIRLLLSEINLGAHKNFVQTLQVCKGQYIAYLEGDDFWTSPQKLQKQVNYLDNHSDCAICFHDVLVFYKNEDQIISYGNQCATNQKEISNIEDLLLCNFIPSPSVMWRRSFVDKIPDWVFKLNLSDWPFHILNSQYGNIGYINEVMAAYRLHSAGAWAGKSREWQLKNTIETLKNLRIYLDSRYEAVIEKSISYYSARLEYLSSAENIAFIDNLNLKDINLIIFPNWSQSEDLLYQDLTSVITNLVNHPDKNRITLLVHIGIFSEDEVNLFLSDVVINLLLTKNLDVVEEPEITLIGQLEQIHWQALFPHIYARIILQNEDYQAMSQARSYSYKAVKVENIPVFEINAVVN